MTRVTIELFGIARQRAGVSETQAHGSKLCEVLDDLAGRYPDLARTCFEGGKLKPGFVANLDGDRFINDPETPLPKDSSLLILSADAGG